MVRSVLARLGTQQSGTCRKPHDIADIGTLLDKADVLCLPGQNEAKKRVQVLGLFMIFKRKGLNASEVGVGKCFENSQLCSFDVWFAKANALQRKLFEDLGKRFTVNENFLNDRYARAAHEFWNSRASPPR